MIVKPITYEGSYESLTAINNFLWRNVYVHDCLFLFSYVSIYHNCTLQTETVITSKNEIFKTEINGTLNNNILSTTYN